MFYAIFRSIMVTLLLALILCGAYPLAVWGVGNLLFHKQANGGLLLIEGKPVGATLIGQNFSRPEYFHPRPSAAGNGYDAANSSGSNLGPTNPKLLDNLKANLKKVLDENPGVTADQVPSDLVTSSGSGLDPHISPPGADLQTDRVAKARQMPLAELKKLIRENTEGPQWGIFGEAGVNVLRLNLTLDRLNPVRSSETKSETKP